MACYLRGTMRALRRREKLLLSLGAGCIGMSAYELYIHAKKWGLDGVRGGEGDDCARFPLSLSLSLLSGFSGGAAAAGGTRLVWFRVICLCFFSCAVTC